MDWSAAILAGGLSKRFGSPKFLARVGGESLIRRVARAVAPPSGDLLIVMGQDADEELSRAALFELRGMAELSRGAPRVVKDTPGPKVIAAGIEAALLNAAYDRVAVVAVDLPFLSRGLVLHLVERATGKDAAVPAYGGFYEPGCAVYCKAFLPVISSYRVTPDGPVHRCFEHADVALVEEPEVRLFGDPKRLFFNVNTQEDLAQAEALMNPNGGGPT